MKTDTISRFSEIDIEGCEIKSLLIRPRAKIVLELLQIAPAMEVGRVCELQFNRVLHNTICVQSSPWFGQISEYRAHSELSYILERLKREERRLYDPEDLTHFSLKFSHGTLDIIAVDFQFDTIMEIPRPKK